MKILDKIQQNIEQVSFNEVIDYIDENFIFIPTSFKNGELYNEANQNNGSCKIFTFAQKLDLNKDQTLHLFGDFYRKDVLENPEGTNHQNIRNFIKFGWEGIKFDGNALADI